MTALAFGQASLTLLTMAVLTASYHLRPDAEHSARLAIVRSPSSLIGECCSSRTVFKMATLFIRCLTILLFPNSILQIAPASGQTWQEAVQAAGCTAWAF